ncbi:MAG: cytochrome c1, partial [Pseudomonadota bacterium]
AILRAVTIDLGGVFTAKFLGFVAMIGAIVVLFFLPWLDKSPVRSIRYKGWMPKIMLLLFAATFVVLGYLGVKAPTDGRTILAQIGTLFYFVFFITMPIWTNPESPKVKSLLNWVICIVLGIALAWISFSLIDKDVPVFVRFFGLALALLTALTPWLTSKDSVSPEPERLQMQGLPRGLVLLGLLFFIFMTLAPIKAVAAGGAYACGSIPCDEFKADLGNKESLQSGAKWFVNYCMGCHSAKFSRYERVADDLGIPHDVMMDNLVFSDQKIGELMHISMVSEKSKAWFGATPPDLTLVARARSPEWLYTYLRNFYQDDGRPLGVNNRVFANVGMPHVFLELQGLLTCSSEPDSDQQCGALVEGSIKGSMTADEFDQTIYDLVNFLEYIGDPSAENRRYTGVFVLLFLLLLLVFTVLLNREYWKGIH